MPIAGVVLVLGWALGLLGALVLGLRVAGPEWWWVVALLAATPLVTVVVSVGAVVLLSMRRMLAAVVVLVVAAALVATQWPLVPWPASPSASASVGSPTLTVMSANVRLGLGDAATIVRLVRTHRVDVLTVVELTAEEVSRLRAAGLNRLLPHHELHPATYATGAGVWSRYPLTATAGPRPLVFHAVAVRVDVPSLGSVPVLAAHPVSPWPGPTKRWARDLVTLGRWTAQQGRSLVVGGDFNASTDAPQLRALLRGGLADAAGQAHAGWVPTYPADSSLPPLLAIDHVLAGARWRTTSFQTLSVPGSDHRAVLARLVQSRR